MLRVRNHSKSQYIIYAVPERIWAQSVALVSGFTDTGIYYSCTIVVKVYWMYLCACMCRQVYVCALRRHEGNRICMCMCMCITRLDIGRPQTRWDEGVDNARRILASRTHSTNGGNALSIGTIIFNACSKARAFAEQYSQHVNP
jgi:hypothetical protein